MGPSASDLAIQKQNSDDHAANLAMIQAERDQMTQQQNLLQTNQNNFQAQQQTYADQLTQWTQAATSTVNRPAPAVAAAPGTVSTGADAGVASDDEADAGSVAKKRGRAALKIDLASAPYAGSSSSGLNIPIG